MKNFGGWWVVLLWLSGCATGVAGTWTGVMNSPDKVGVRFVIEEKDGRLAGRVFFEDPVTRQFEPESQLVGATTDGSASWTTETNVQISGKFEGSKFVGTILFPADGDEPAHSAALTLSR